MHSFGEQLKFFRDQQGLTLNEVSDKAAVSVSMISRIERGQAQPTLDVALRLADALGKDLSEMLNKEVRSRTVLIPKSDQLALTSEDGSLEVRSVLSDRGRSELTCLYFRSQPLGFSYSGPNPADEFPADAEAYIWLLSGSLSVTVGSEVLLMQSGDMLCFDPEEAHEFKSLGNEWVEYLMIISGKQHIALPMFKLQTD